MFQQTVKNFAINFNALNERGSVSGGDQITGHLSFDLTKPTKITAISMQVKGMANVHWSTGGGGGKKRRRRKHFAAKLDFFNFKSIIVQENSVTGVTIFQPGTHVYPFTCQLPQGDFPSTFTGVHGKIQYALEVCIHRPWHMSKDFVTELNFVHHINTNQPELH